MSGFNAAIVVTKYILMTLTALEVTGYVTSVMKIG